MSALRSEYSFSNSGVHPSRKFAGDVSMRDDLGLRLEAKSVHGKSAHQVRPLVADAPMPRAANTEACKYNMMEIQVT